MSSGSDEFADEDEAGVSEDQTSQIFSEQERQQDLSHRLNAQIGVCQTLSDNGLRNRGRSARTQCSPVTQSLSFEGFIHTLLHPMQ